jgi:exosortase K
MTTRKHQVDGFVQRSTWTRVGQLIAILLCAFTLKQLYSTASVNELRWILAPTTFLVELVSGTTFNFEAHAGYMSSDRSFLIAASCAGVNFMIAAFLMLSIGRLWKQKLSWNSMPAALILAYGATVVANTVRISTALQLQQTPLEIRGLTANQLHRLEGILIYFGFLLLLFLITEQLSDRTSRDPESAESARERYRSPWLLFLHSHNRFPLIRQFFFPLLVYYATTLGMPVANSLYRQEFAGLAFLEHSAFVLLAPLLLIVPLAAFRFFRVRLTSQRAH